MPFQIDTPHPKYEDKADRIAECKARRSASRNWLENNWWPHFERTVKAYMQVGDPVDSGLAQRPSGLVDMHGRIISSMGGYHLGIQDDEPICPPHLYAVARRRAARMNANIPNLRVRCDDPERGDRVSTALMNWWQYGGGRATQEKNLLQADVFGISIREVSWADRKRRVRLNLPGDLSLEQIEWVEKTYPDEMTELRAEVEAKWEATPVRDGEMVTMSEESVRREAASLLALQLGGRIPVVMEKRGYVGAEYKTLFIGDVWPEPECNGFRNSSWLIDQCEVNAQWLQDFYNKWKFDRNIEPKLADALNEAYRERESANSLLGSSIGDEDYNKLRGRMYDLIGRSRGGEIGNANGPAISPVENSDRRDRKWLLTRVMYPDAINGTFVEYILNDKYYLGYFPLDYQLDDNYLPIHACVFNVDLFGMFGDSMLKRMTALQELHTRLLNQRFALVDCIQRPLIFTNDEGLAQDPYRLMRGLGYRVVYVDNLNAVRLEDQSSAIASAAAGMSNDTAIYQLIQVLSGETNPSMGANVDPQQGRTATGARIMQFNADVLTRDSTSSVEEFVAQEMEITRQIARSEMDEPIVIHRAGGTTITVTAEDFNQEGNIQIEAGSMLADADESKVQAAGTLWGMSKEAPDIMNIKKARDKMLTALGEGSRLAEWDPPPPPPPPPNDPRVGVNVSVAMSAKDMGPEAQVLVLNKVMESIGGEPPKPEPGPTPMDLPPGPVEGPAGPQEGPGMSDEGMMEDELGDGNTYFQQ